jgi:DNA-binding LacI/PurR family transcriptional regulator
MGLRVPNISVVGLRRPSHRVGQHPFLTVAAQPAYEIGRRAAEIMIDSLVGVERRQASPLVLPFE